MARPKPQSEVSGVRARVLAAGRAEFARAGLEGASVRTVAEQAQVTPAMINYYFGGKRGLYDEVVSEAHDRLFARLGAAVGQGGRAGLGPRLAAAYFDFLAEDSQTQRLLLRQVLDQGPELRALVEGYVRPLRALFVRHFGARDEAAQLALSLFGAIAGSFLYQPVLAPFLGADAQSPRALARRRRHVVRLATRLERSSR